MKTQLVGQKKYIGYKRTHHICTHICKPKNDTLLTKTHRWTLCTKAKSQTHKSSVKLNRKLDIKNSCKLAITLEGTYRHHINHIDISSKVWMKSTNESDHEKQGKNGQIPYYGQRALKNAPSKLREHKQHQITAVQTKIIATGISPHKPRLQIPDVLVHASNTSKKL